MLSIVMLTNTIFDQNANASFLQIEKKTYEKGDIILIYGTVDSYNSSFKVIIQIFDNNHNLLLTSSTYPKQDGSFLSRIPTNDTNWKTGGPYDISVQYGSHYIGDDTFVYYSDQLPPLKQEQEIPFWNIQCNSGLVIIMKQEDGSIACVKPSSLQKLISLNWGYDPNEKITTYGLKTVYHVGQEIDFKFRVNGFGNICEQPTVTVRDSDQKIIWQSQQYTTGCAIGIQSGHMEDEAYLGRESHLGYDYNQYGPLIINKTGTYFMNISWLDGNITKQFTVISLAPENITSTQLEQNNTKAVNGQIVNHGPPMKPFGPRIHLSHTNSIRDISFIKLLLTTNSTIIRQGQTIGLDISLNNTASNKLVLNSDNNWGLPDLSFDPCIPRPYGIAVFNGYYTEQNMTDGGPLLIFNPDASCPAINSTKSYVFEPESTNATVSTCSDSNLPYCTYSQDMQDKIVISGTWDEGNLQPLKAGVYTLVGGDEWGHLVIQHFVVTNSTIFAGNLGGMSCPAFQFGIDTKIENTTGFTLYSPSKYIDNLVLAAGNTGHLTLTYNYSRPTNGPPDIVGKPLNLTNYGVLAYMAKVMSQKSLLAQYEITISPDLPWQPLHVCHYDPQIGGQSTPCYPDQYKIISQVGPGPIPYNSGINVDIEPKWIMISPNSTSTFTATISANKTALPGSYWVSLGHGYCGPSQMIELVIQ
ncbi:MAG: hypothetical protein KGI25_08395 [Thaumarchaeota archaeon]|nr:hypothetical protein [Nitrososphaerota archaeon]